MRPGVRSVDALDQAAVAVVIADGHDTAEIVAACAVSGREERAARPDHPACAPGHTQSRTSYRKRVRVETKAGGDGVLCWNVTALQAYAEQTNAQEARLGAANPDLVVHPGRVTCYGCEVMEYDYGIKCTALLTRTLFVVAGEIEPRAEDADRSVSEIPGLATRAPEDVQPAATAEPVIPQPAAAAPGHTPAAPLPKRSGLRGMFGR